MKLKRIVAAATVAVMLFAFNCYPFAYADPGGPLSLAEELEGDISNAITDVEYGSTGTTYRFDDNVLTGVEEGKDVYLIADAAYNPADPTINDNVKITLTNFKLAGADAEDYTLPNELSTIEEPVEKEIKIVPRALSLAALLGDDIKNAIATVEYGSTNSSYVFDNDVLDGVVGGDEVYLVADAAYDSEVIGSAKVTLTKFRLEGAKANYYKVPEIAGPIEENIAITRKPLSLAASLNNDIGGAITAVEYGSTGTPYRFKDGILDGIVDGDEVYLVADSAYAPANPTISDSAKITLTNFGLAGAQAANYIMPTISPPGEKNISIVQRTVNIVPDHPYIYFGQTKPTQIIDEIADYSSQLVPDENLTVSATFNIQVSDAISDNYAVSIQPDTLTIDGDDKDNYNVILDPNAKFSVLKYEPTKTAVTASNKHDGVNTAVLFAPEGFLISETNNSGWGASITINLTETQAGTATYYLRNNGSDPEYFGAISEPKTYGYTSIQTKPEIKSIRVEKTEPSSALNFLNFLTFGVFGNGGVRVTVVASGASVEQETTIYLGEDSDENDKYDSEIVTVDQAELKSDSKYYYTAVFEYPASAGDFTKNLKAYAKNSSGTSGKYSTLTGISDTDGKEKSVISKPLVLDTVMPAVKIGDIKSNYQKNWSEVTISDTGAGIAKVEYGWDLVQDLCNDEKNEEKGHYLGFKQNEFTDQYVNYDFENAEIIDELEITFELEYYQDSKQAFVWAEGNQHTLYIRVTDNAGNVHIVSKTDEVGSDMDAPNITSIEIKKASTATSSSPLRFFSFGTFYNDAVEVVVLADDNGTVSSGVKSVTLNGQTMTENESVPGEYVLTVSADDSIKGISITATDKAGWTTTEAAMDIPSKGSIESADLLIENKEPTIDFEFSSDGHEDYKGDVWYGSGDIDETLEITTAEIGEVKSGLYSVEIKDNDTDKLIDADFSKAIDLEHAGTYIIGELGDSEHIFSVTAEDNAGNTYSDSRTFYKDTVEPKGTIAAILPECVMIGDEQWFDKDEVITFRVDALDNYSGLKNISLKINDEAFNFGYNDIKPNEGYGYYVEADTTGLEPDSEHKYTVTGTVTDFANNTFTLEPLTVYKDLENPVIDRFTVEKRNNALDKILNVLTFGAYSNDTLIFKAYTSDIEFDSGIDYATVIYTGLSAPAKMSDEDNGVFSVEIPVGPAVFESDITVVVYDKYGKTSTSCPNIEDAQTGALSGGVFAMIETIEPLMTLSMPPGDGVPRTDDQVWYNSNKTIELQVQDSNSGIRNIDVTVNGRDVAADRGGVALLKTTATAAAAGRNTAEQNYVFDTDYFTSITGKPEDGKYVIALEITDNAGNITTHETTYYIDDIMPSIDRIDFVPVTSDGISDTSDFIEELEYGFYFKTDFIVTVNVSDETPSSGLYEVQYNFVPYQNGEKLPEIGGAEKIIDGQATLNVPKGFKGQIFVDAFDYVLNRSGNQTTKAYVADDSALEIDITKNVTTNYHDTAGNNLYVSDNSITVVVTDTVSGIREIGYAQSSEHNSYDRKIIRVNNAGYPVGADLGDGWIVSAVDVNLVTKVTKTFTFSADDNDVILTFDATDNSWNKLENVRSEKFTVDKTNPIINIVFRSDEAQNNYYYAQNRIADITVIDRNFDANLIKVAIENAFGNVPSFSFTEQSNTEHTAVINFDEGDYTFDVTGKDLGNHDAAVNFSGGNEKLFYVDKTQPVIEENFAEFGNSAEDSFKIDKTVTIRVTEHNFDPAFVNLQITRKEAGAEHNADGLAVVTDELVGGASWVDEGDVHTISFTFDYDALYQIGIAPTDLAGNTADQRSSVVFEIDKTVPVVEKKNDLFVSSEDVEFLDVYPYERKDDPTPTVEFADLNIDHIKYNLTVYIPDYSSSEALTVIRPVRMYAREDTNKSGIIAGSKFTLPALVKDGVYALELVGVDVAGNESVLNSNTYARMVEQDVLAYIMESNVEAKTGLYSFQYENGDTISKRPDNFDDIEIFVMTKKETHTDIVLRDNNGEEVNTNAQIEMDDSHYGMGIYRYTVKPNFFKESFQDDTDVELHLTVKNEGSRVDLGKMHIDNIAPTGTTSSEFDSWHWYFGEKDRTVTVSHISELVDVDECKVYDNGEEVAFDYSSEDNTVTFTLTKGWHNVGIILDDMAGNANNIQEKTNIHIGFFWLWVIISSSLMAMAAAALITIRSIKIKRNVEDE